MNAFEVIIPTYNHAAWLDEMIDYYLNLNVKPLYIVDGRTTDNTRLVIKSKGLSYYEYTPQGDFPEAGMLEFGSLMARTDWILRLDDDELPTKALFQWIQEVGVYSHNQCWHISRRELYRNEENKITYSRSVTKYSLKGHLDQMHPMARFFNRRRIEFISEIHTNGFNQLNLYGFVPQDAFIIHLNCILNSMGTRLNKIRNYERIKKDSSWKLGDEYLPELFDSNWHSPQMDGLEEFITIISKIESFQLKHEFDITPDELIYLYRSVLSRVRDLSNGVKESLKKEMYDADQLFWTKYIPKSSWRALSKLLCSVGTPRVKQLGVLLWNYCDLFLSPR